jgi:hypothetical protein
MQQKSGAGSLIQSLCCMHGLCGNRGIFNSMLDSNLLGTDLPQSFKQHTMMCHVMCYTV